ncbi:hypothetical protein JANAI62_05490 [Jannaschia pagri]|uniref:Flp pilus assembly protein, pilin Flp n=1 Tax=Jannaschia pagri TaxID=2829797 RepID=A0ABQ4NHP6_9RHOB|nr:MULTISPECIES: hypothetical protein [unclassified Jannaschia]GIT89967.1 hypothetical protein JANAI61_04250 [Jannaschia sp. AI_61]GIT93926.1 hypothetical protein JANAI62_05490 [Jannaschia sp. AI_62]
MNWLVNMRARACDETGSVPFPVIVMVVALLGLAATVIGGVTMGVETSSVFDGQERLR